MAKVLVEISTKDRDDILGRMIASLILSSYQDFDVLIINDGFGEIGKNKATSFFLDILRKRHKVWIIEGTHISQAHNHNIPLYDVRFRDYEYILRADDDILFNYYAIERLVYTLETTNASAVSGLWFEDEWANEEFHDRAEMSWYYLDKPDTAGKVGLLNSNWQQRLYSKSYLYPEHLYSNCLYKASDMRCAGGWPEVYSKGVAHGEETDGTYRLFLSGGFLVVNPEVTGQHLKAAGGIRSSKDVGGKQMLDNQKWANRLPKLREINFNPKVAIWCQHQFGIGGAQRFYYKLISDLQKVMDVYPIFEAEGYRFEHITPEDCLKFFGFTYCERKLLEEYDVCLVIGHYPFKPVKAKHYILYTFFPDGENYSFEGFDQVLGISDYTSGWIRKKWGVDAKTCYYIPFPMLSAYCNQKENVIIHVSRLDPHKSLSAVIDIFKRKLRNDFKLWIVGSQVPDYFDYAEEIREIARLDERIELFESVNQEQLEELYSRSKFIISAMGYQASKPSLFEHFGLTPLEAAKFGVIPVVYNGGGFVETVPEYLRWNNEDELVKIILGLKDAVVSDFSLDDGRPIINRDFIYKDDVFEVENYIRRVNACALELEYVETASVTKKIRVAAIADSPFLTTGFGAVAKEIYKPLTQDKDIELCVLGIMDSKPQKPFSNIDFAFYPAPANDPQCYKELPNFIKWAEPDVIFELYDPGNLWYHLQVLLTLGIKIPTVCYFPVEGDPVVETVQHIVRNVNFPVTYCKASANLVEKYTGAKIDYAYHGIDHAPFSPLDAEKREQIRRTVGFDNKFVIYNVGTNKRVKELYYLIEALDIVLKRGYKDVYLYLHTKKFDQNVMQGWNLEWIIKTLDQSGELASHVLFPVMQDKFRGTPYRFEKDFVFGGVPQDSQMRGLIFNGLDYITRLGLADLYIDVSSAEGWGLPPLEAVACGVPMISVEDGLVRTEVHKNYAIDMLRPVHYCRWHTGAKLLLVSPEEIADKIIYHKNKTYDTSHLARKVLNDLKWQDTASKFLNLIKEAYKNKDI